MEREKVIVIDFGGQYNQLVARRVRECNVYCEIYSYKIDIEKIKAMNPKGIILTGGPNSCYEPDSPTCILKNSLSLAFRYLVFVMVHSLCLTYLAEKLKKLTSENMVRQKSSSTRKIPKYLKMYLQQQPAG